MIKKKVVAILICLIGILKAPVHGQSNSITGKGLEKFEMEMKELKSYFHIPGLAILIKKDEKIIYEKYLGKSNLDQDIAVDSTTLFPIASVTKLFTSTVIMKLVEEKKLSLDERLASYFPEQDIDSTIQLKHVLSHTSQGVPGKQFYYSSRFGTLTKIIEKSSGKPYEENIKDIIIDPLDLKHTFLLKDSIQIKKRTENFARPYNYDGSINEGTIEYGFSASAGIVSTARDLSKFDTALNSNQIISKASRNQLFTGIDPSFPYGFGIFDQNYEGKQIDWAYGQYDSYSSLFLKVPSENITLILLANNNFLSDPARLIYGDVTSSLFAVSFLKNLVFNKSQLPLLAKEKTNAGELNTLYRDKLKAQALAASFLSRFDLKKFEESAALLHQLFKHFPEYQNYSDLSLLHNLLFLKEVAFHRDLGEFNDFDQKIIAIAKQLLAIDPENPYANYYLATFYDKSGKLQQAKPYFSTIIKANNFSENWYSREAKVWLNQNK